MQWLFDIIRGVVAADIGYVDRGDPGAWDFEMGDLTLDGAFHTLHLASIVPEHAVAVSLKVNLRNTSANKKFDIRKDGNANPHCTCALWTQVANIRLGGVFTISLSEFRSIEYSATAGGWNLANLQVNGWWLHRTEF